jgi:hypothetical protein
MLIWFLSLLSTTNQKLSECWKGVELHSYRSFKKAMIRGVYGSTDKRKLKKTQNCCAWDLENHRDAKAPRG